MTDIPLYLRSLQTHALLCGCGIPDVPQEAPAVLGADRTWQSYIKRMSDAQRLKALHVLLEQNFGYGVDSEVGYDDGDKEPWAYEPLGEFPPRGESLYWRSTGESILEE